MTSGVRSLVLDVDSGKAWLALAASGSNEDGATASTSTTPRLEGCKKRSGPTPPRGRDAKAAVVRMRPFTVSASRPPSRISGPPCSLGVGEGRQEPGDHRLGGSLEPAITGGWGGSGIVQPGTWYSSGPWAQVREPPRGPASSRGSSPVPPWDQEGCGRPCGCGRRLAGPPPPG